MPTAERRATARQRVQRALDLHAEGHSVRDIATALDCTPARAARLLAEGIASLPGQALEELRATSELRLDRAARVYGSMLDSEDERTRLQAAAGVVNVERLRTDLLGTKLRAPREDE